VSRRSRFRKRRRERPVGARPCQDRVEVAWEQSASRNWRGPGKPVIAVSSSPQGNLGGTAESNFRPNLGMEVFYFLISF